MPLRSEAQRRWMYWAESKGKLPKGTAKRWEAHTKNKELPEKVKKELVTKSSGWSTVINNVVSNPVDLETNILSQYDEQAAPYLDYLKSLVENAEVNEPIQGDIKGYKISIYKVENGIFSGKLMDRNYNIMMMFNDQTLSILASMISAKIGNEENTDEFGRKNVEEEIVLEDIKEEKLTDSSKKMNVNIDKDGNIYIEIMKSEEKNMKSYEILSKLYKDLIKADGEDLEYIKTTPHEGGEQHWYKDKKTNKIVEKESAPGQSTTSEAVSKEDIESLVEIINGLVDRVEAIEVGTEEKAEEVPAEEMPAEEVPAEEKAPEEVSAEEKAPEEMPSEEKAPEEKAPEEVSEEKAPEEMSAEEKAPEEMSAEEKAPEEAEVSSEEAAQKVSELVNEDQAKKIIEKLKQKFPNISKAQEEKIISYINKVKKDSTPNTKEEEGEEVLEKEEKKEVLEKKKKVLKKSRLQRMWKIFEIDMPEKIETSQEIEMAKSGRKVLVSKIVDQGKDLKKAQIITNNTLVEKYGEECISKLEDPKPIVRKSILNGLQVDESYKTPTTPAEMHELRKIDSKNKFSISEFKEKEVNLSKSINTGINDKIEKMMNPEGLVFEGFKVFDEEKIKKSLNEKEKEIEIMERETQKRNWDVPEYKEKNCNLVKKVESNINKSIEKSLEPKETEINWGDSYKVFDEEKTKKLMNKEKTESEKYNEKKQIDFWTKENK